MNELSLFAAALTSLHAPERLGKLNTLGLVGSPPEDSYDRITSRVTKELGVPISLVSLLTDKNQYFKSTHGLPPSLAALRETPLTHSLCQHVVNSGSSLLIEDAKYDALVCDNQAVTEMGVAAYLGTPITTRDGHILGSLCAIDTSPRKWAESDLATLRDYAAIVEDIIALREEIINSTESSKRLQEALNVNEILRQELNHRVKNMFALASSLIRHAGIGQTTVQGTVDRARSYLETLSRAHDATGITAGADNTLLMAVVESVMKPYENRFELIDLSGAMVSSQKITPLGLILHELATNSLKYGALGAEGQVIISLEQNQDEINGFILAWEERGGPIISGPPQKNGFGSRLLDMATQQLNGNLHLDWQPQGLVAKLGMTTL